MDAKSAKPFEDSRAIEGWCALRDLPVRVAAPLGDGALNLHWALEQVEGDAALVFRCRGEGHWITAGFEAEARAMTLARQVGVLAPEVVLAGAQALVMTRLEGSASREAALATAAESPAFRQDVTSQLHRLRTGTTIDPDDSPGEPWLAQVIDAYIAAPQGGLKLLTQPERARAIAAAALETGIGRVCLNHGDLRTGNLLVQGGRLSGVLDWEFAGYRPERHDYGGTLVLEHQPGDGPAFRALYGHLSKASADRLSAGDSFAAGDVIAWLGDVPENGGWPPHLHLQLGGSDAPDDPGAWPGVVDADDWDLWAQLFPNPATLAGVEPARVDARPPTLASMRARRSALTTANLKLSYSDPVHMIRGQGCTVGVDKCQSKSFRK